MTDHTNRAELEAQIEALDYDIQDAERKQAALRAQLAALDAEPEPLLIEAREIAAHTRRHVRGHYSACHVADKIEAGTWDDHMLVTAALAALRRGMELASLDQRGMTEQEIEALAKECVGSVKGLYFDSSSCQHSHRAFQSARLVSRATLSRAPVAGWPGEAEELAMMQEAFCDSYPWASMKDFAARLRAYMTNGNKETEAPVNLPGIALQMDFSGMRKPTDGEQPA